MARKMKMKTEGAELLHAVKQMKAGKKGRVYTPGAIIGYFRSPVSQIDSAAICKPHQCFCRFSPGLGAGPAVSPWCS